MNQNGIIIRPETKEDYRAVEALVREAFWNVYRPGCSEHYVIHVLRDDPAFVRELDFVMEQDGELIGHENENHAPRRRCRAGGNSGNIGFYGHCGFTYARNFSIRYHDLPQGADDSFFLCKELVPGYLDGVSGVYQTPRGYYVDEGDVEAFDAAFPYKEKLRLPGQIF